MPGTVTEDIEIIDAGHGGGTGTPAGGDDDSGSPGSRRPVPRRAYFTALQLGLAAIVMFFMALASSYIVRKGLGTDWQVGEVQEIARAHGWTETAVRIRLLRARRAVGKRFAA